MSAPTEVLKQSKIISIQNVSIDTYSTRKYPDGFYAWANVTYEGVKYDMGDPFPSSVFPKYEGVTSLLIILSANFSLTVSEREYRQLFKGIKGGAELYARYAGRLERAGISFE